MKIEVTRAFSIAGKPQTVGQIIDTDPLLAAELIHANKARIAPESPVAPAAKPTAAAKPKKESKNEPV